MKSMIKTMLKMGLPVPFFVRPVIRGLYYLGVAVTEGLIFLRKLFYVEPVLRSVAQVGKGLWADRLPYMRGKGRLIIGSNVRLSGQSCFYFMNTEEILTQSAQRSQRREDKQVPVIEIGDDVFIGNGCTLAAARSIIIGDHALISAGVRIHDNDGHPKDAGRRRDGGRITADEVRPVVIGQNAWLGAGAVILKGVTVGKDAIVGAGAVVTSNIPDGVTFAGNPANKTMKAE